MNKDIHSFRIAEHFTDVSNKLWIEKFTDIARPVDVGQVNSLDLASFSRELDASCKGIAPLLEIVIEFSKSIDFVRKAFLRSSFSQIVSELEHGLTNMLQS